ncbi:MAG: NYN domain-containing protein [Candidatus Aenigmarchaeota archaeon]|nr:NYN domain-containing protein [Candidatus Aenigmarchaeota archaeon]
MIFRRKKKSLAVFIDGPNLLRKEFNIDLGKVKKRLEKFGRIVIAKVFLNQFAPEKLIEAITNQGFEPVVIMSKEKGRDEESDVDVAMAVEATEAIFNPNIDVIVIGTRDADFIPLVRKIKAKGKEAVVLAVNSAFSVGLRNVADKVVLVK